MCEFVEWIDGRRLYRHPVHGRVAPAVTSILAGSSPSLSTSDIEAGSLRHRQFVSLVRGQHVADVDPLFARRVHQFMDTYTPEILATEQTVWGGAIPHEYAGTLDLRCRIGNTEVVVDLKTGSRDVPAWGALQVAAYANGYAVLGETGVAAVARSGFGALLHLPPDSDMWELLWVDMEVAADAFEQRLRGVVSTRLDRRRLFQPEHRVLAAIRTRDSAPALARGPAAAHGPTEYSRAMRTAVQGCAAAGEFDRAIQLLDSIHDDDAWIGAIVDVALSAVRRGESALAAAVVTENLDRFRPAPALTLLRAEERRQDATNPWTWDDPLKEALMDVVSRGDLQFMLEQGEMESAIQVALDLPSRSRRRAWMDEALATLCSGGPVAPATLSTVDSFVDPLTQARTYLALLDWRPIASPTEGDPVGDHASRLEIRDQLLRSARTSAGHVVDPSMRCRLLIAVLTKASASPLFAAELRADVLRLAETELSIEEEFSMLVRLMGVKSTETDMAIRAISAVESPTSRVGLLKRNWDEITLGLDDEPLVALAEQLDDGLERVDFLAALAVEAELSDEATRLALGDLIEVDEPIADKLEALASAIQTEEHVLWPRLVGEVMESDLEHDEIMTWFDWVASRIEHLRVLGLDERDLDEVVEEVRRIPQGPLLSACALRMVPVLGQMEMHDAALELAQQIAAADGRSEAMADLAELQVSGGGPWLAMECVARLIEEPDADAQICRIVDAMVAVGEYSYAVKAALEIPSVAVRGHVLRSLALPLVEGQGASDPTLSDGVARDHEADALAKALLAAGEDRLPEIVQRVADSSQYDVS